MEELGWSVIYLAIFIAGFFLRGLLSGYAGEKGKNLATKEDIRGITEKVEGVRYEFSTQLEKLKADLNANIQQQLSIFGKRNEALTQFFEDASSVLVFLRSPFHFRYEDLDGLDRHIREGQDRIVRSFSSYYRLMIYVRGGNILTPAHKALAALSTLHGNWFGLMLEYRGAFAIEAEEWELSKKTYNYSYFEQFEQTDRPSAQVFSKIVQDIVGTLDTFEGSLNDYALALNAHFHSVDKSKALAETTDESMPNARGKLKKPEGTRAGR